MYDLWDRAYELLKAKDGKLSSRYESILPKELRAGNTSQMLLTASFGMLASIGKLDRHYQLKALLEKKIKDDEESFCGSFRLTSRKL